MLAWSMNKRHKRLKRFQLKQGAFGNGVTYWAYQRFQSQVLAFWFSVEMTSQRSKYKEEEWKREGIGRRRSRKTLSKMRFLNSSYGFLFFFYPEWAPKSVWLGDKRKKKIEKLLIHNNWLAKNLRESKVLGDKMIFQTLFNILLTVFLPLFFHIFWLYNKELSDCSFLFPSLFISPMHFNVST